MKFSKGDKVYYVGPNHRWKDTVGVIVGFGETVLHGIVITYAKVRFAGKDLVCCHDNLISVKQHALKEFFK